jgi:hypothetical protein
MGCCKTISHGPFAPLSNPETSSSWANGTIHKWNHYVSRCRSVLSHVTVRDTASCPASIRRMSG